MQACRSVVDFYAGVFNEASGRWNVKLDADDVNRTAVLSHIAARPVNLIQREVSGRNLAAAHSRLLCTALLPLHARVRLIAHTLRHACHLRRKRSMRMLLMRKIPDLGPFSSAALVAVRLQP